MKYAVPFLKLPYLFCLFCMATAAAQERPGNATGIVIGPNTLCTISDQAETACDTTPISLVLKPPADLGPVQQLAMGQNHACALEINGNIRCWGGNFFGQLDVPPLASPAIAIEAGEAHSCALTSAGSIVCWGLERNARTEVPDTGAQYSALSVGASHSCAVTTDGNLECWGESEGGAMRGLDNLPPLQAVSAGLNRTCVLTVDGQILCSQVYADRLPPPSNSPYNSLSFSGGDNKGGIICGLDDAGNADCVVQPPKFLFDPLNTFLADAEQAANTRARLIEQAARDAGPFINIDTASIPIRVNDGADDFAVFGCGVKADGAVACWSTPSGIDLTVANDRPDFVVNVTAQIYSATAIELLWPPVFSFRSGVGEGSYEILRNGEVHTQVNSSSSFYDDSLQPETDYRYQVRAVSASGLRGDLSPEVLVNTSSRNDPAVGGYVRPERLLEPTNLAAQVYGANTVELIWDRSPFDVKGYEILINGVYTDFTNGTSYFMDTLNPDTVYQFDVISIDNDNNIGGYASTTVTLGEPLLCF